MSSVLTPADLIVRCFFYDLSHITSPTLGFQHLFLFALIDHITSVPKHVSDFSFFFIYETEFVQFFSYLGDRICSIFSGAGKFSLSGGQRWLT